MKRKKKNSLSAYQKATMLMDRETNRAVANVQMLKRLYAEAQEKSKAGA